MITRTLAEYVRNLSFERIPGFVIQESKKHILDILGVALAGSRTTQGEMIANFSSEFTGKQESTTIGYGRKTSCLNAALANSIMSKAHCFDDTHEVGCIHPGSAIIPAALALSERESMSGRDLIEAVVCGYDISIAIAVAVTPWHTLRGYHATGTCNSFGAAAAAGKILRLDERQLTYALGLAGHQAAGLLQFEDSAEPGFHAGKAAQNGVLASLLAKTGFATTSKILEGKFGFCQVLSDNYDLSKLTHGLGETFKITETSIKLFPCCRYLHGPVWGLLKLVKEYDLRPEDVQKVVVRTFDKAISSCNRPHPSIVIDAWRSFQHTLAVALIKREVSINDFDVEKIRDEKTQKIASRIQVVPEPRFTELFPEKWPYMVELFSKDGKKYRLKADFPPGSTVPSSTEQPLTSEQILNKFKMNASVCLDEDRIDQLVEILTHLEQVTNMKELTGLLGISAHTRTKVSAM